MNFGDIAVCDMAVYGDRNAICDGCGWKVKLSELKARWDGFYVCPDCWEPKPEQLDLRVNPERERQIHGGGSEPEDRFVDPETGSGSFLRLHEDLSYLRLASGGRLKLSEE